MRKIEKMSDNVADQLKNDFTKCECFSLQLDESTDIRDAAQIVVFIRMVFNDWTVKEEVFSVITLKERTRGTDIYTSFKKYCTEIGLVAITTDGAKSMVGSVNGFVALCRRDDDFSDFLQ